MTKRQSLETKRERKQQQLLTRTAAIFSCTVSEAEKYLSQSLQPAIRINPLAATPANILQKMMKLGWKGKSVAWCAHGYTIESGFEALRDSSLTTDGAIYLQNPSSWVPVIALDPQPGESVLDVCAAPGGKSSHIAALIQNTGRLVVNDNSKPRLARLRYNLARLGVSADFSLVDATHLSHTLNGTEFDKILLDAPCSGEGLITLTSPKTLDTWSVAHIRRLATLQKRLLQEAWRVLKPGGRLVYSTCTMAPEENEAVIDWLLRRQHNVIVTPLPFAISNAGRGIAGWNNHHFHSEIEQTVRLTPVDGREAFFTAILEKSTEPSGLS